MSWAPPTTYKVQNLAPEQMSTPLSSIMLIQLYTNKLFKFKVT